MTIRCVDGWLLKYFELSDEPEHLGTCPHLTEGGCKQCDTAITLDALHAEAARLTASPP